MSQIHRSNLLISPSQAARLLNVPVRRVRELVDAGDLPVAARTPGGHRRYALHNVLRLRDEQRDDGRPS